MAKFFRIALFIVVSLIAFLAYALFSEPTPSKTDQKFIDSIQAHLKEPGDWAKLSDIHPGNWAKVCFVPSMSLSGGNTRKSVKKIFGIQTEDINLPNGIPFASDWNSAAMFFYPPNTVEGFEIPTSKYLGFGTQVLEGRGCLRSHNEEVILLLHDSPLDKSARIITVMTLDKLEETQKLMMKEGK